MITASQAVRYVLAANHLVTAEADADWRCVLTKLPDGAGVRDNVLAVTEIEGAVDGRFVSTSEIITHPHIRILCRSTSYDAGYAKMQQIADVIDVLTEYSIIIGNESVILHQTSRQTGIVSSGVDSTMRRYRFSLDYEIVLR